MFIVVAKRQAPIAATTSTKAPTDRRSPRRRAGISNTPGLASAAAPPQRRAHA